MTDSLLGALRTIPHGGIDDSTRDLEVAPHIRASVSPIVNAFRWAAVLYGMIFGIKAVFDTGSYAVVVSLTVCLFLTTWRTMLPIHLASRQLRHQVIALTDVAIISAAVGWSGGTSSPYIFCAVVAVVIAAFGFGWFAGWASVGISVVTMFVADQVSPEGPLMGWDGNTRAIAILTSVLVFLAAAGQNRLIEAEQQRQQIEGRADMLNETNELLTVLNQIARTMPSTLDHREAIASAQQQIAATFGSPVVCIVERSDSTEEWTPKLAEGCIVNPASTLDELPPVFATIAARGGSQLVTSNDGVGMLGEHSGSGMYARLDARDRVVGIIAVEDPDPARFQQSELLLLEGLADVVALTLDNARWFGRLRALGAESERSRIARDLHDRLGQWLTYLSLELERLSTTDPDHPEIKRLHGDALNALEELRETLRQLRTAITPERRLDTVGAEFVARFGERTGIACDFVAVHPGEHHGLGVENELLRITQEALNNIDKHAKATSVVVTWDAAGDEPTLVITDNGVGFSPTGSIRDNAYGLVGMRERADVIGAHLSIHSEPGAGTTITVQLSPNHEELQP